jgi:hypothetical protein
MPKAQLLEVFLNHSFQGILSAFACSLPATVLNVLYLPLPLTSILYVGRFIYVGIFLCILYSCRRNY